PDGLSGGRAASPGLTCYERLGRLEAPAYPWDAYPREASDEEVLMGSRRMVVPLSLAVALSLVCGGAALGAGGDVRVTRDATESSYLRYDGTSDATTEACSTGKRSQNEPTVAVDPHDTAVIAAGANDYCAQIKNGDVWTGYYRSTDGGSSWHDSLVPGYPADT